MQAIASQPVEVEYLRQPNDVGLLLVRLPDQSPASHQAIQALLRSTHMDIEFEGYNELWHVMYLKFFIGAKRVCAVRRNCCSELGGWVIIDLHVCH